ncbi:MAG TPA: hypothetical protein VEB69_07100, partial [Acidimicrobiia bacterium]|nr:hypothetical protein [Acidimicrobiia bacterium]
MSASRIVRSLIVLLAAALMLVASPAESARAGGTVGTGTAASCTEAAFEAALAGGGFVSFDCGAGEATITVTTRKTISDDTHIDGDGFVTISGGNSTGIFTVDEDVSLTLEDLGVAHGYVETRGGAVYNDGGFVSISGGTLSSNAAWQDFGGAIYNTNHGVVSVADTTISDSFSNGGGAIYNDTG